MISKSFSIVCPTDVSTSNGFVIYLDETVLPTDMFDSSGLTAANSDGGDIRFYADSNLTVQLAAEVTRFHIASDPSEGYAGIFVRLTSFLEFIYITYSDRTKSMLPATSPYGRNAVWLDYYVVWHMDSLVDSTGNGADLTPVGSVTSVSGLNGNGYYYYPNGSYHTFSISGINMSTGIFVSCLMNPDNISTGKSVMTLSNNSTTAFEFFVNGNNYRIRYVDNSTGTTRTTTSLNSTTIVSGSYIFLHAYLRESGSFSDIGYGDINLDSGTFLNGHPYTPNNGIISNAVSGSFAVDELRIRRTQESNLRYAYNNINFLRMEYDILTNPSRYVTYYGINPISEFSINLIDSPSPAYLRLNDLSDLSSVTSATDYIRIWKITNNRTSADISLSATIATVDFVLEGLYGDTFNVSLSAVY